MTLEEFARTVQLMREAQNRFFQTRSNAALRTSKGLERAVDAAVKRILPDPPKKFDQTQMPFGDMPATTKFEPHE